jgi:hypothetical protein
MDSLRLINSYIVKKQIVVWELMGLALHFHNSILLKCKLWCKIPVPWATLKRCVLSSFYGTSYETIIINTKKLKTLKTLVI